MRKLVFILLVFGFIQAGFAQEVKSDYPLKVNVTGVVYGTSYDAVMKDVNGDYSAIRMRPMFTYTNSDIEAVLMLEYDGLFGVKTTSDDKISENVGLTSDKKGLEVARAYIKSKIDAIPGLTIKGGIADYDYPLIFGDNAPLVGLNYTSGIVNLNLVYMKPSEGELNKDKDDSQIYIADITFKIADATIRPAFFAYQCERTAVVGHYKDSIGYMPALSMSLPMGAFGIDMTGVFSIGKDKVNKSDYRAYAFDFAPYYQPTGSLKLTAFFTMVSGDDNIATGDNNSFLDASIDGRGIGINSFRLYIIEDGGAFTTYSDVTATGTYTNYNGYMAFGASAGAELGLVKIKLQGAYVQAAKVASNQKRDMGIEVDANISYGITKSSTLYVEGAYLKAGKYYETTDTSTGNAGTVEIQNPYYVNVGMKYSI